MFLSEIWGQAITNPQLKKEQTEREELGNVRTAVIRNSNRLLDRLLVKIYVI